MKKIDHSILLRNLNWAVTELAQTWTGEAKSSVYELVHWTGEVHPSLQEMWSDMQPQLERLLQDLYAGSHKEEVVQRVAGELGNLHQRVLKHWIEHYPPY